MSQGPEQSSISTLDQLLPLDEDERTSVRATRAMLIKMGESAAQEIYAIESQAYSGMTADEVRDNLAFRTQLFLEDINQSAAGVAYDDDGNCIDIRQVVDELILVGQNEFQEHRIEMLQEQLRTQRDAIAATERELALLVAESGSSTAESIDTETVISQGGQSAEIIDLATHRARRKIGFRGIKAAFLGMSATLLR